jgi:hypothetical protein
VPWKLLTIKRADLTAEREPFRAALRILQSPPFHHLVFTRSGNKYLSANRNGCPQIRDQDSYFQTLASSYRFGAVIAL